MRAAFKEVTSFRSIYVFQDYHKPARGDIKKMNNRNKGKGNCYD
jgi:hypothetical protein